MSDNERFSDRMIEIEIHMIESFTMITARKRSSKATLRDTNERMILMIRCQRIRA